MASDLPDPNPADLGPGLRVGALRRQPARASAALPAAWLDKPQRAVAVQRSGPDGHANHAVNQFVRGKGLFVETDYLLTEEKANRKFPLLLTTGHILSQYNVGAQTRRTANTVWHGEDLLEIHPGDAETRGVRDGQLVSLASRKGEITLRAPITTRVQPGVVYTTFHNPETGANVVTTEFSGRATNCPEYKVTAVQVTPASHRSTWQQEFEKREKTRTLIASTISSAGWISRCLLQRIGREVQSIFFLSLHEADLFATKHIERAKLDIR